MIAFRRLLSLLFTATIAAVASLLAIGYFSSDGLQWLDIARVVLLAISTAWLAWGAVLALNGLLSSERRRETASPSQSRSEAKTVVLVPVYNEEPAKTFSHVAAMAKSLIHLGVESRFDFAILSDTNDEHIAAKEVFWLARLREEVGDTCHVYYRRRQSNPGKKAGNIADFIKSSGALYEYLIILDADSLMEGATMVEMVRRMEEDPELGLLQTLPKVIRAQSFFGRAIQFSASYYSPLYARGVAALQGAEGPFWGHNAITRTRAFAQSCGLPELSGRPPFGGHILSHDYVEAALLARNGWKVRLDPDMRGSFEEGPDNVVDFAKRDRRWCQGNLQHGRVLVAPRLRGWSRFTFVQGIMAYVAAPLWALFLAASIIAPSIKEVPDYFPVPGLLPVFPRVEQAEALALLTGVFGLLIGPKLLILLHGALTGRNRRFGGTLRCAANMLTEIISTSILAPVMMLFQTRAVLEVLAGADSGWPAANRDAGRVNLAETWSASWWIVVAGLVTIGAAYQLAPDYLPWVLLVAAPQIAAPLLISITSRPSNALKQRLGLFCTVEEAAPSPVMQIQQAVLANWRADPAFKSADAFTKVGMSSQFGSAR